MVGNCNFMIISALYKCLMSKSVFLWRWGRGGEEWCPQAPTARDHIFSIRSMSKAVLPNRPWSLHTTDHLCHSTLTARTRWRTTSFVYLAFLYRCCPIKHVQWVYSGDELSVPQNALHPKLHNKLRQNLVGLTCYTCIKNCRTRLIFICIRYVR
jgi:hypothetical protein